VSRNWKLDFPKIVFDYSPGIQRFLPGAAAEVEAVDAAAAAGARDKRYQGQPAAGGSD
jgi:hypothetical protein